MKPRQWMPLPAAMSLLRLSRESVLSFVRAGRLQARLCGNFWWIKSAGVLMLARQLDARRKGVAA